MGGKVPGGFRIGERVYLTAFEQSSDKEETPDRFMVTGWGEEGVRVRLDGGSEVNCGVASLNREGPPPRFPGGFLYGEQLYYTGPSLETWLPSAHWDGGDGVHKTAPPLSLSMQFEGNRDRISCTLARLSEEEWGAGFMAWFCRFYIPKLDEPKLQIPDVHGEGNGRGPGDHSSPNPADQCFAMTLLPITGDGVLPQATNSPYSACSASQTPCNHWRWIAPPGDQFTMRWFLDHAVVDALLDDPQSPLERDAAIFDLKMLLMARGLADYHYQATALFHVHRAWRTTPYHGVGGWLGAYTTIVAGEGSRLAGDVATPGSGAYYRQILVGSVAAWFGCYLLLYLIVRRRSALPGAAAFRVTTNLPRDSDVFTVDITPLG
ncbi:hypothetical protein EMIHUDRAFT_241379 [Emiliania huxleyi CCMP1516]|uniref:DOMON domain-containing protein n=2 Tax=Emiliania huxleyi TaxID=2903 RepID=A0A0D3JCU3_EMIH1|nr:hypothetical protein EMIHUDRAFT_241379 [Emiliania huxleyi CCMP1516]EOD21328.1 hypothetical protein EMIHUDRAFT_241379 [Emiliania huxleyi CCMP1516]|eukprot:XP_005773757.1 hypothetical protein EMIHUDRAFT_241379 [Emiliania huxleyi CCMP1516]